MKKEILINELQKIEKKLIDYFEDVQDGYKSKGENKYKSLKILDKDIRSTIQGYNGYYTIQGYTGVTVKYLRKYLFNNKYSCSLLHYVLIKLLKEKLIQTLYCCNIRQIVFENKKNNHPCIGFNSISNYYNTRHNIIGTNGSRYNKLYRNYKSINDYLNNNNIEDTDSRLVISV